MFDRSKNKLIQLMYFLAVSLIIFPATVFPLAITSATLTISADDSFAAYISGVLVHDTGLIATGEPWNVVYAFDLLNPVNYLPCGDNVLAINYYDTMGT